MRIKRMPNYEPLKKLPPLGERVKQARIECGLSTKELSKMLGFKSAVALSLKESGKRRFTAEELIKISWHTKLGFNYFIYGEPSN